MDPESTPSRTSVPIAGHMPRNTKGEPVSRFPLGIHITFSIVSCFQHLQLLEELPHEVSESHHLLYLDVPNIGNPEGIDVPKFAWVDGKA